MLTTGAGVRESRSLETAAEKSHGKPLREGARPRLRPRRRNLVFGRRRRLGALPHTAAGAAVRAAHVGSADAGLGADAARRHGAAPRLFLLRRREGYHMPYSLLSRQHRDAEPRVCAAPRTLGRHRTPRAQGGEGVHGAAIRTCCRRAPCAFPLQHPTPFLSRCASSIRSRGRSGGTTTRAAHRPRLLTWGPCRRTCASAAESAGCTARTAAGA